VAGEQDGGARFATNALTIRCLDAWMDQHLPMAMRAGEGVPAPWMAATVGALLEAYGRRHEDGGVASFETHRSRNDVLCLAFKLAASRSRQDTRGPDNDKNGQDEMAANSLFKQLRVSTRANENDGLIVILKLIDQQQVAPRMTFPVAIPLGL
jgi:hypothetical protein